MLRIALRNLMRQRARAGLTLAAIALGVASLVLSGGFVADILAQLREATIRSELGHLQIFREGQFASAGQRPFDFLIDDASAIDRALDRLPGVVAHGRRLAFTGLIDNGRAELPIIGEGVSPESEARIGSALTMLSGRALATGDRYGIVLGEG